MHNGITLDAHSRHKEIYDQAWPYAYVDYHCTTPSSSCNHTSCSHYHGYTTTAITNSNDDGRGLYFTCFFRLSCSQAIAILLREVVVAGVFWTQIFTNLRHGRSSQW